jgi:hypothetical protein
MVQVVFNSTLMRLIARVDFVSFGLWANCAECVGETWLIHISRNTLSCFPIYYHNKHIQGVPGGKVSILGGLVSVILSKNIICTCPFPNGFRDRPIPQYIQKLLIRKRYYLLFRIPIFYCSGDKVGTVYPAKYIFENSTVNINALCNTCDDMACCSSLQCSVYSRVK